MPSEACPTLMPADRPDIGFAVAQRAVRMLTKSYPSVHTQFGEAMATLLARIVKRGFRKRASQHPKGVDLQPSAAH